jgi:hypothetical protein
MSTLPLIPSSARPTQTPLRQALLRTEILETGESPHKSFVTKYVYLDNSVDYFDGKNWFKELPTGVN